MEIISSYKEIFKDPNYDRVNNPNRLSIGELLPIGVEWFIGEKCFRIDFECSAKILLLKDKSGIAIVEVCSDKVNKNSAYVVNSDGTRRFSVQLPQKHINGQIYDVYYIQNDLFFFFNDNDDYRVLVDENDGRVKNIMQTR
jgi:hypothetical protein